MATNVIRACTTKKSVSISTLYFFAWMDGWLEQVWETKNYAHFFYFYKVITVLLYTHLNNVRHSCMSNSECHVLLGDCVNAIRPRVCCGHLIRKTSGMYSTVPCVHTYIHTLTKRLRYGPHTERNMEPPLDQELMQHEYALCSMYTTGE